MLSNVFRLARPAARLNVWSKPSTTSSRAFSVSAARKSGHPSPQLLGEGGKAGEVPTDINQSTGLERLQTLGFLEGIDVFDSQPLDSSRIGTLDNPVLVYSLVRFFFHLKTLCRPPSYRACFVLGVCGLTLGFLMVSRTSSALWDVPDLLRILTISSGTPFTRTSCFVVGNVVPVSPGCCLT